MLPQVVNEPFHDRSLLALVNGLTTSATNADPKITYNFQDFWHPFVGELITKLNQESVAGMLSPAFLKGLTLDYYSTPAQPTDMYTPDSATTIEPGVIDTQIGGAYANYNWELLYHIPVMVAVHLSNNQYFADAERWFHLVFDPTSTDTTRPIPDRYWKSFVFSDPSNILTNITTLLQELSNNTLPPNMKTALINGYNAILANPFKPHVVARTRPSAYQWYVVMKYLDNLIAWGDQGFLADTIETLNEATLRYVQAHKLLGAAAQRMPQQGAASSRNFLQLKQAGLDRMSNAMVDLEAQFPFNTTGGPGPGASAGSNAGGPDGDQSGVLFGIGRSLYFCIPPNQKLLSYWDVVADRLFKIRNSENIQGIAQQLPLFDPPLDPGMLVKAAAAGIDISSIVSGLNQPTGPIRSQLLIQKALEIAAEVRSLGAALLAAYEKGDAEALALTRQTHEYNLQQLVQTSRFAQWQHAKKTTDALFTSRAATYEQYTYYLGLLNLSPDPNAAPQNLPNPDELAQRQDGFELTESNFDTTFQTLVGQYDLTISELAYNQQQPAQGTSPASASGATGTGQMYLNERENTELGTLRPQALVYRTSANVTNATAAAIAPLPSIRTDEHFWGLGFNTDGFNAEGWANAGRIGADILNLLAAFQTDQAEIASRTATYQRRANEWTQQANVHTKNLMATGRQILASLVAELVARHDYKTAKTQAAQAFDVMTFLQTKTTNADFYNLWQQGELSALYYKYYRFAVDTARKAEATMKHELMRPELDSTTFIGYDYWDAGHHGWLSGEKLYLDIKQMELAYHDSNKRELELTRHISLAQLDPLALINLRITGSCTFTVPEWLYDWDCPGLYMRRTKTVAVSVFGVTGPYTSVNCTLTLLNSTLRTSPLLANGAYARDNSQDDDRFTDYFGATDIVVTSSGINDSGMFETNLRDERFLPFEGAGAISTWQLTLPTPLRNFDYTTITDVILHIRYTARHGGNELAAQATKELATDLSPTASGSSSASTTISQGLLLSLRHDFPTEWAAYIDSAAAGTPAPFTAPLSIQRFPYTVQYALQAANPNATVLQIDAATLYTNGTGPSVDKISSGPVTNIATLQSDLNNAKGNPPNQATLTLGSDLQNVLPPGGNPDRHQEVFLVLQYSFKVR
jgi:hypothetical protein